ncbi:MAG: esterase family protein [Clostridiales bacterium]|nr:esterase family protein [Clostridiales bacterium]
MYLLEHHFPSQELQMETSAYVLLPDLHRMDEESRKNIPTLYLLHGMHGNQTDWIRRTRLEYYASQYQYRIAIVMPAAANSFYTDMVHGERYYSYITKELPAIMESAFSLSPKREDRFVAGLSMGGYGALKIGMSLPDRYSTIGSFSGAVMLEESYSPSSNQSAEFMHMMDNIFGSEEGLRSGDSNLSLLAKKLSAAPEKAPKMYIACGTEDFLFEANEYFVSKFKDQLPIDYFTETGTHDWDFWDRHVKQFLAWLPLTKVRYK